MIRLLLFLLALFPAIVFGQSSTCAGADPFCTTSGTYTFPASTGAGSAQSGPSYGCLGSQPNPAWYYMQIGNPGNIDITITSNPPRDIDFILYGPFSTPTGACPPGAGQQGQLTAGNTVDCSYAGGTGPEYANITNAQTGQFYLLLLTNYSNQPTNISFGQSGGTGSTNCGVICGMNITGNAGTCSLPSNKFSVTGAVTFTNPPTTGTLTITDNSGASQVFNPPFTSPTNFTLNNVCPNGASHTVTAAFSANAICSSTFTYTAPASCATASSNSPVCTNDVLNLTASTVTGATYSWTGPGGFTSNLQNPSRPNVTSAMAGVYTVTIVAGGCTTTATTTVQVSAQPTINVNSSIVCSGQNVTLSANGGSTYSWSTGDTGPTINVSPTATTTYTVTGTNASGCSNTAQSIITVKPLPTANAGADKVICQGGSTTLNGSGGGLYIWSPNNGSLSSLNSATPIASPAVTTTYTLSVVVQGCTDTDHVVVDVIPFPVSSAGQDITICSGDTGALGDLPTVGVTYSWSPSTGLSSTSVSNPFVSLENNITASVQSTYTVIASSGGGMCNDTDYVVVTTNPIPPSNAGNDAVICSGDTAFIGAPGASAFTFSWNPVTGVSNPVASDPYVILSNSTASPVLFPYVVTTSFANCSTTDTVQITVNPIPVADAGQDTTICFGASVQLQGSGGSTFEWSPNDGSLNNAFVSNPIASPTSTTTYTLTANDAACYDTDIIIVTVDQGVVLDATNDTIICEGQSVQLNVTGAVTYSWSPASSLTNPNTASPVANPLSTTTYTVTGTQGTCLATALVVVAVSPPMSLTLGLTNDSCYNSCNGFAVVIPSGGTGVYTYSWSSGSTSPMASGLCAGSYTVTVFDEVGCSIDSTIVITQPLPLVTDSTSSTSSNCSQPNGTATIYVSGGTGNAYSYSWNGTAQTTQTAYNLVPGWHLVTYYDQNGCSKVDSILVGNIPGPVLTIISTDSTTCNNSSDGSITVSASGGVGSYAYFWQSPLSTSGPNSGMVAAGTYTVIVYDDSLCTDTVSATVYEPTPVTIPTIEPVTICNGQSTTLVATAQGGTSPYSYSWSPSTNLSGTTGSPSASPTDTTVYSVIATDANNCISISQTATVNVLDPISVVAGQDSTICQGGTAQIWVTASGGDGTYNYLWNPVPLTNDTISVSPIITTQFNVTVDDGCTVLPATTSVTVNVNPLPVVAFLSPNPADCYPFNAQFVTNAPGACLWEFGDGSTESGPCSQLFSHTYSNTVNGDQTYDVTLTVTDFNGCVNEVTYDDYITAYGYPEAEFSYGPQPTTIVNPNVYFTDESIDAYSWNWTFGETEGSSAEQSPIYTYADTGNYNVWLTVANEHGCIDSVMHIVRIDDDFLVFVPNAFSPNGDQINDEFFVRGIGMDASKFELLIFDRWGSLVFQSKSIDKGWNGRLNNNGDFCEQEVYIWKLTAFDEVLKAPRSLTGTVTIVR